MKISLFSSLLVQQVAATITNVPALNGPLVPLSPPGGKTGLGQFKHPGMWHSHDDLELMRTKVAAGEDPWATAFKSFSNNTYSSADYEMRGPKSVISRGTVSNYSSFTDDTRAAWQNALMWYITRQDGYWNKATEIIDAWGSNLTNIIGTDTSLLVGLEGDMLVNAAEIMRWEGNWTEAGAKWQGGSGFSNQLYWLFARQSIIIGQANYGMASIKALLDFAVYLEDVTMYNYALNAYLFDFCAGLPGLFKTGTGQSSESGRDQSHVMSGIGWTALAAKTLETQGFDVWDRLDDVLLTASEYTAKFNLNETVPYDPKFCRCEAVLVDGPWDTISEYNRGITSSLPGPWDIIYYTYVVGQGKDGPWTSKAKAAYDANGGQLTGGAHLEMPPFGNLVFAREPKGKGR